MADTLHATPQLRIAYSLHQARQYRHHRNCHCGTYAGYCNANDQRWTEAMDREIDGLKR
jgi:hypothetical protein